MLTLTDILLKAGLDPKRVMLIRHPLSNARFRTCYHKGFFYEYTCHQKIGFSDAFDYWMVFVGDQGSTALLKGVYRVAGCSPCDQLACPAGYPFPDDYISGHVYYHLQSVPAFDELTDRLIIDWGTGARSWHQSARLTKKIAAIQRYAREVFPGYERLVLDYAQLKSILEDSIAYSDWHAALSSVYAIYLIADTTNGKMYVGSAYGADGLLGRWRCYVKTGHGNNKEIREAILASPEQYRHFRFSILQILPKNLSPEAVVALENLYKEKLLSREFGMNGN